MDDAQLIDSPRERPALTFVQFADDADTIRRKKRCSEPRLSFSKSVVLRYRIHLESRHTAPA